MFIIYEDICMKSQPAFFKPGETVTIDITSDKHINYKELDARVLSIGICTEGNPMQTDVTVLKAHEKGIINLLKHQAGIQRVNNQRTEYGINKDQSFNFDDESRCVVS